MPNRVLFISDLHLSATNPEMVALFMHFLEGPVKGAKALYILGDLFDVWVGQDIHREFQETIQQALAKVVKAGTPVYFMSGNRDFLLQNAYLEAAGIKRLADPTLIDLHGKPTLLMHGDTLCTQDKAYQRFRRIAQNPLTRFLFLCLPKNTRDNISKKLRAKSQQYQKTQNLTILDVTEEAVQQVMNKFQVNQLIHGHVHRPNIHDNKRFVLGDWHHTASLIISTPDGNSLATYDATNGIKIVSEANKEPTL
ncbi:MAG: UDP-2,3-diacylglucosamine diphosphatase [Candidatus Berkiella sp.]